VCLAWALQRYERVETVGFDYGQRHAIELRQRVRVLNTMRATLPTLTAGLGQDHYLDLPTLARISETALTRDAEITFSETGLPTTFVPGRNLLFLTYASAVGYRRGIDVLVGGMCETDYSGYPDCRESTLASQAQTLSLGLDRQIVIETPLVHVSKAGTWSMAEALGGQPLVDLIIEHTHTCYLGNRELRHAWGYGCGSCPACELRRVGFEVYQGLERERVSGGGDGTAA